MPTQLFRMKARFRSGKQKNLEGKLINFRGSKDDPEDMERARKALNRLTPHNVEILPDGFEMIGEDPQAKTVQTVEQLGHRGLEPEKSSGPVVQRMTPTGEASGPTNSTTRVATEDERKAHEDTLRGNQPGNQGTQTGSGSVDLSSEQSGASESPGRSTGKTKR
jgi:hypothetical protein